MAVDKAVAAAGKPMAEFTSGDQKGVMEQVEKAGELAAFMEAWKKAEQAVKDEANIVKQAAREAEDFADHYEKRVQAVTESLRHRAEAQDAEAQAIGKTAGEVAKLKAMEDLRHQAQRDNLPITEEMLKQAEAVGLNTQRVAELRQQYDQLNSVGKTVASSLESAFAKFAQTGKFSFSDMIKSMLLDLEKLAFKMALMPIFGGTAANPGGLFGDLMKGALSFGGGKAGGGPLDSGKWYIAGEHGPEPIWGGGSGAFASGYGKGGAGGGAGHMTYTVNIEGAYGREELAAMMKQTGESAVASALARSREALPNWSRSSKMLTA
jgi:hypothetical protein